MVGSILATLAVFVFAVISYVGYLGGSEGLYNVYGVILITGHWLFPILLLTLAARSFERDRSAYSLVLRIRETRGMFAYIAFAWLAYLLILALVWVHALWLPLPAFYIALPALAYANLVSPRARVHRAIRIFAVGLSMGASALWALLEWYAPWPPQSAVGLLILGVLSFGGLGLVMLIVLALLPAAPRFSVSS